MPETKPVKKPTGGKPARTARRAFDWEEIEAQYRAGVLSTVQIAKAHGLTEGAIRARAKTKDWVRDLSTKIRVRTEAELLRVEARGRRLDEKGTIHQAVITRIDISERQRASIDRLRRIADAIVSRVEELNPKIEIYDYATADKAVGVVAKATSAVGQLIALERQSWAMDEPAAQTAASATDDLIKRLAAMSKQD